MRFYWLMLGVLAVWRVSHLLSFESGPFQLLERMRRRVKNGFFRGLLDCFYCISLWIAIPFAAILGEGKKERFLLWLALSAGAILLHRATEPESARPSPVLYYEDQLEEHEHVLR
jgi:hypothetical protein